MKLVCALAVLGASLLGGCTTGTVDKNIVFNSGSQTALVILGWEGLEQWRGRTIELNFRGVDADGKPNKRWFYAMNANGWTSMKPVEYFVMEVEPGRYQAESTLTSVYPNNVIVEFCKGTFGFDALAGKAVYIGNFAAPERQGAIVPSRPDLTAARARIAEFPGISQTLDLASLEKVERPKFSGCDSQ